MEGRQNLTRGGVKEMRPTGVWSTIKQVQLETRLLGVPRAQRIKLRAYIAGSKPKK
jgi:hypothetical protein